MLSTNHLNQSHVRRLAIKAIERKKKINPLMIADQKQENNLFSQFDVLEHFPSKNGKTTLYHLAKRDAPNQHFCCKVLNENANMLARNMILNEGRRLKSSQHPNVIKFIKSGNVFNRPYIMCEWITGCSLAQKIHSNEVFPLEKIISFVYQVADALECMHARGICHLDIKPSNVMVTENDIIKLIDFGSARYINIPEAYIEVSLKYASPLYLSSGVAKAQDDVYSLALLTAHLFIGGKYDDAWNEVLTQKKPPSFIPVHIWKLIKRVILHPRTHKYTVMSFAHELTCFEQKMIPLNKLALPFIEAKKNLPSPRKKSSSPGFSRINMTHIKSLLLLCLLFLFGGSFLTTFEISKGIAADNKTQNTGIHTLMLPESMASFLSQSSWEQKNILDRIPSANMHRLSYEKAPQSQDEIPSQRFYRQQNVFASQRKNAENTSIAMDQSDNNTAPTHGAFAVLGALNNHKKEASF